MEALVDSGWAACIIAQIKPAALQDVPFEWVSGKAMYELATCTSRDFDLMDTVRTELVTTSVVLHAKSPKGRKHRNRQGVSARNSNSRKSAQREREPWLLVASP